MVSPLEPRVMLSAVTVNTSADNTTADNFLSLREAVALLNAGGNANAAFGRALTTQEALQVNTTEAFGTNDTVRFASSTNGNAIVLGGTQIDITRTMAIIGNGGGNTVVDGNQQSRIFEATSTVGDLTIQGMTLTRGAVDAGGGFTRFYNGGAAVRSNLSGTLRIVDSALTQNSVTGEAYGGAATTLSGLLEVTRSTFSGNSTAFSGGALYERHGATITDSTFSNNSAARQGGAIQANLFMVVSGSTFVGNTSVREGGAVGQVSNKGMLFVNSTFSGNQVTGSSSNGGGAIFLDDGDVTIVNCTITGNSANVNGGIGILADNAGESLTIVNSIIAGNTAATNPDFNAPGNPGANLSVRNSLIGRSDGTSLSPTVGSTPGPNGNFIGGTDSESAINPLLAPLASNGGPTQTHAFLAGSLALDHGNNALAVDPAHGNAALTADQRGAPFARISGGTVDIGAYESQTVAGLSLVVDNATDENDGDYSAGDLSLREAVGLANGSLGADTITFSSTLNGTPILLDGTTFGDMDITDSVTIIGNGAAVTVLDAQQRSRFFALSESDTNLTLERLTLQNGRTTANDEGGGAIQATTSNVLTIRDSVLTGNSTIGMGSKGGAIQLGNGSELHVERSTLSRNSVQSMGGSAVFAEASLIVISDSTVSANISEGLNAAGAIASAYGQTKIVNSTVSGNQATGSGVAVYVFGGSLEVVNSTVTQNTGNSISGLYLVSATATIHNSIVAGNTGESPDLWKFNSSVTVSHSLIGSNSGNGLAATGTSTPDINGNYIGGSGAAVINPQLAPLAYNGGPRQTHALLSNSLAIDGGDNTLAVDPSNSNAALTRDERGAPFVRTFGGTVDMGAVERQTVAGLNLVVDNATDENDGDYSAGDLSLREAVGLANGSVGTDTITFAPALNGVAILLTMGQMSITESLTITGNGVANTIIDGQQRSRMFLITGTDTDVVFDSLTLQNGRTTGVSEGGGAVRLSADLNSTVAFRNSLIQGNSTTGSLAHGGAVFAQSGQVFVTGSTFTQNEAEAADADGGAIYSFRNFVGGVDLATANSTFSGNSAGRDGGAIRVYASILASNVTVTQNTAADDGGGVYIDIRDSNVQIRNSIIAGNTDTGGESPDLHIRFITSNSYVFSHNLLGDAGGSFLVPTVDTTPDANGNYIGAHGTPIDPKLGTLGDNGGPTPTHALLAGSLAVNHGDNAQAFDPSSGNSLLTTDQRGTGFDRIVGGTVDMGAVERETIDFIELIVDENSDVDDGDFSEGHRSLREAVRLANSQAGEDTITFAAALNGMTILITGGQMEVTESVIITGNGATQTVLDAGQLSRFFLITGDGANFTLEGVTLKNGRTNAAGARGGAIFSNSASANLVTIRDSILSDNATQVGASQGGAIYLSSDNSLLIERSTLTRNEAGGSSSGGAIYAAGNGTLTIVASTLSDNAAVDDIGGAIFSSVRDVAIRESTLSGNRAESGGAFFSVVGTVAFTNSTISGNQSTRNGAGIFLQFANATVTNSTVTQNHSARFGGGIVTNGNGAVLTLRNSIVSGNTATLFAPDFYQGSAAAPTVQNSLIGDNQGSDLAATGTATTPGTNGNFIGTHTAPINAGLAPLANNGGPTQTHALLPGSRAINRGSNALATDPTDDNASLTTDQRGTGFPRVRGTSVDMGAFEFIAPPVIANFGAGVVWTEGQPPAVISGIASVTDADSPNFSGGTLTVSLTNNARPGDILGIRNQGTGAGQISISGNTVNYRATAAGPITPIGTSVGGANGQPLVITFNANATPATVSALLKNLTFVNTTDDPTNAQRTVQVQMTDGAGGVSTAMTKTITVTPMNDASTINNWTGPVTYTEHDAPVALDADATITDPDSPDFNLGSIVVQITVNGTSTDQLSLRQGPTLQGGVVSLTRTGAQNQFNVLVDGVNIGTMSGGANGATLTINLGANATQARTNAVLQSLTFSNTSHTPSNKPRTIRISFTDGDGGNVQNSLKTVNVVPVNDAPVIGNGPTAPVTYAGQPLLPFPAVTLTDLDTAVFNDGTLTFQSTNGATGDTLGIRNQGTGLGQINVVTVSGVHQVRSGFTVIGTFTGGLDGAPLVIALKANATTASVQALMRNLTFSTTNLGSLPRTLSMTLREADGTSSNAVTQTVNGSVAT